MLVIKNYMILMHFGLALGIDNYSFSITEVCYQLYDGVIHDVYGTRSLAACSIHCTEDNCCSFLFDKTSQRCITYSAFATSTMPECGWKYAEIDSDICRGPMPYTPTAPNLCDLGYSFDASDNKCRANCVSYGSTYGRSDGYYIYGYNRLISGSSEQACKDACTAETTFECRTAELWYNQNCYLSEETVLTRPDMYDQNSQSTHWQRNCA